MERVEETFKANRKRVVTNKREGKTENSNDLRTFIVNIKIKKERAMLTVKKRSRKNEGKGIKNIVKISTIITTTMISPLKAIRDNKLLCPD